MYSELCCLVGGLFTVGDVCIVNCVAWSVVCLL